jgi:hypothetical protein
MLKKQLRWSDLRTEFANAIEIFAVEACALTRSGFALAYSDHLILQVDIGEAPRSRRIVVAGERASMGSK